MAKEWTLQTIWNDTLAQQQKALVRRDHIWAGEIGKNFYERYLKMSAVEYDTPFDDRVLRKFSAGIWFEDQIGYILKKIGIVKSSQERIEIPETENTLKVTGKIDYVAGGITNWNEARDRVKKEEFPEFIEKVSLKLIDYFEKEYPEGLEETILEIKSVNSQVFWAKKDYLNEAYPHHEMQAYTYAKCKDKHATIVYISKDDLTIAERPVLKGTLKFEERWQKDVQQMTYYWKNQIVPPKPENIVFDPRKKLRFQHNKEKCVIQGCWTENWEIAWSPYFKTITGFEDEDKWSDSLKKEIGDRNEVLKDNYKVKLETNANIKEK